MSSYKCKKEILEGLRELDLLSSIDMTNRLHHLESNHAQLGRELEGRPVDFSSILQPDS